MRLKDFRRKVHQDESIPSHPQELFLALSRIFDVVQGCNLVAQPDFLSRLTKGAVPQPSLFALLKVHIAFAEYTSDLPSTGENGMVIESREPALRQGGFCSLREFAIVFFSKPLLIALFHSKIDRSNCRKE
jgi:hypothetical protein